MTDKDNDSSVFDGGVQDTGQPSVEGLIARLTTATEGSRRLDGDIVETLGLQKNHAPRMRGIADDAAFALSAGHCWIAPRYTTSLDAALTLVPDGLEWDVGLYIEGRRYYESCITKPGQVAHDFVVEAATPALALCIAALKARQTVPQTEV